MLSPNARIVVTLGQKLGLSVIAEGVETQAQRDFLAQSGCHAYQGYYFSQPLPLEAFERYAQRVLERKRSESGIERMPLHG